LTSDLTKIIVEDFLKNSWHTIEVIVQGLARFKEDREKKVNLFYFKNGRKNDLTIDGGHFFLRGSVEYSNPQLTVEEVQGIIATRLLEVCGNHFYQYGLHQVDNKDVDVICEMSTKPPQGAIVSFLLNTDETEPDRYSMNPLKESIVSSGQSAFPSASVKTNGLKIDDKFVQKYQGSLISKGEVELITRHLETCNNSYVDMADAVKYEQLESLSERFGIDLRLYSMRMPLTILGKETTDGLSHHIIKEIHANYQSIERAYNCMGRSIKSRTTLLTVPHSKKGYGSKRAARGKIYFEGTKLKSVKVSYRTTPLYPNAIDPKDVSIAIAEDDFSVEGENLTNYNFRETPSSPQFFLYSLASPENAAIWHGIGAFASPQLLTSYTAIRVACTRDSLIKGLKEKYHFSTDIPLQFNLTPQNMWVHPVHRNIDASIGCVENLADLANMGMRLEYLSAYERNLDKIEKVF
jgi:hypothetical protein